MKFRGAWKDLLAFTVLLLGFGGVSLFGDSDTNNEKDLVPNGKGNRTLLSPAGEGSPSGRASKPAKTGNGINYHGGPLMLGTPKVYYIWYGDWSGAASGAVGILEDLAKNIAPSPYYNINTTYYNGSNTKVSNAVDWGRSTTTNNGYPRGKALSDSAIQGVVSDAINSGALPKDSNGVYFVLTSKDVNATSGFCTQYCGWHTYGTINGATIKYSFVGNPARCPNACEMQTTNSPNGDPGADGMASIIAHELEETVTDPVFTGWYDNKGEENADKCAWTFGSTYNPGNGSLANMKLGARDYLIQRNWVNANGGYCAKSY